jgi:hypothetical protein
MVAAMLAQGLVASLGAIVETSITGETQTYYRQPQFLFGWLRQFWLGEEPYVFGALILAYLTLPVRPAARLWIVVGCYLLYWLVSGKMSLPQDLVLCGVGLTGILAGLFVAALVWKSVDTK